MLTSNMGSNARAKFGDIRAYTCGANPIWRFATVVLRLTDGLAYPAIEDLADDHKQLVIGWALEAATQGNIIRVRADGQLARKFPSVTSDAVGKLAVVKDDETVQTFLDGQGFVVSGRITAIDVEATSVFVDFRDRPIRIATGLYQ